MSAEKERSEHRSDQTGEKPRGRRWSRWALGVCIVLAIAVAAGVIWRLPLAGAVLRAGLDRAGLPGAELTVAALSFSRIHLTGMRLGSELGIASAKAEFDLSRLPENPFTRVTLDGVRGDLTGPDQALRQKFGSRRGGGTPATIRALLDQVPGLPTVAVEDLSLRYGPAGAVATLTGSADTGPEDGGAYGARFAMRLSGELKGDARTVVLDGTARIARDAMVTEVRANTADGEVGWSLTGRADISSDQAAVSGSIRLDLLDLGRLAGLAPVLEGARGKIALTAGTATPVSIGLDTPLGVPGLVAALQRAGPGAVRLKASIADGSLSVGFQGVNGTITAVLGSLPDASDRLRVDGKFSLGAQRFALVPVAAKGADLNGTFRLTRDGKGLTLVFPNAIRGRATEISFNDRTMSVAPVAVSLSSGPTHGLRIGHGGRDLADLRLKLEVEATQARLTGTRARTLDLAPFTLQVAGTADHFGAMKGNIRVPKLSVAQENRMGVIDDLAIDLRRSGSKTTGSMRGRVSALQGGKPLLHPVPVHADVSLFPDKLTFDSKAILPGPSAATAKGRYDRSTGRGTASLSLPPFRMTPGGGEFRALAPSVFGFDIRSGTVRANAELAWDKNGLDGRAAFGVEDMALVDGASGATVQGLSADIRLDRMAPPRTPPNQVVRVKKIVAGVTFDDLSFRFALVDGVAPDVPALNIGSFQTRFAGGRLSVAPTVLDTAAKSSRATITMQNVDLAALLDAVGVDGISGTGRLSGVIPITMDGTVVGITGGRLAAAGPGVLRIRSETAKTALAQGGEEVALMLSALEDFHYETLTMEIEKTADGDGRVVLRTRGKNPAVGAGQPFVINLNLSGNVDRLAAVAAQAFLLPGALVRTMLPK